MKKEEKLEKEITKSLSSRNKWLTKRIGITAIIITLIVISIILILVLRPYISGKATKGTNDLIASTEPENSSIISNQTNSTGNNSTNTSSNTASNRSVTNTTSSSSSSSSSSSDNSTDSSEEDECEEDSDCSSLNGACGYGSCSSGSCEQEYNSSGTICRAVSEECDAVEYCTGSSKSCPSNSYATEGTVCSLGFCDNSGECLGIQINSCQVLNQSNKLYNLNTSIENPDLSGNCIEIVETNITLDCKNYFITSNQSFVGVLSNATETSITNCNISMGAGDGGYGIHLKNANDSHIYNNILNSQYAGLFLEETQASLIELNDINENENKGIHLLTAYNNTIKNNEINNGSFYGIISAKSSSNTIQNNELTGNVWYGISIEASLTGEPDGENQILDNQISYSRENIDVKTSSNIIKGNTLKYSQLYNGLYIYNASNNLIENNILESNKVSGIGLNEASNNNITNNALNSNENYGIEVYSSNSNTIENNTASSNLINGLYVEASSGNTINTNIFCNNTADVYCDSDQTFNTNKCDSGSVCGGNCEVCELGGLGETGITGGAINVKKGLADYTFVIIFIAAIIALAILVNLRKSKRTKN